MLFGGGPMPGVAVEGDFTHPWWGTQVGLWETHPG